VAMPRMTYIGLPYNYYVRVLQTKDSSLNRLQLRDLGEQAGSDVVEGTDRQMRRHGEPAGSDVEPPTDTSTYSCVMPVS